jgi:hypothetical protein
MDALDEGTAAEVSRWDEPCVLKGKRRARWYGKDADARRAAAKVSTAFSVDAGLAIYATVDNATVDVI